MELPASSPFRRAGRSAGPLRATGREHVVYTKFKALAPTSRPSDLLQWSMAKKSTPDPVQQEMEHIAHLLEASLNMSSLNDSRDFVSQSRRYFMERHLALAPNQPIALPSGDSLLVLLSKSSLVDALAWEQLAGPLAWGPTSGHPFPLSAICQNLTSGQGWGKVDIRWPSGSAARQKEIQSFFLNGLTQAMPLTQVSAEALILDKRPRGNPHHAALEAQARVLEFCQREDDLFSAAKKLRWFIQAGGTLVTSTHASNRLKWPILLESGVLTPTTPAFVMSTSFHQEPWTQDWARQGFPSADRMFARLANEAGGYDLPALRLAYIQKELPLQGSWADAKQLLDTTPGAWDYATPGGSLLWQEALIDHPQWLDGLVNEPAARLRARAPKSAGLWGCVLTGWSAFTDDKPRSALAIDALPSRDTIRAVLNKAPLNVPDRGQLFLTRKVADPALGHLFDLTFEQYPSAWVGEPDDQQATRAARLLAWSLVGQSTNAEGREAIAEQAQLLHDAYRRDPSTLTPDTVAVLWCLGQYFANANIKLNTNVSRLATDPDIPFAPTTSGWAETALEGARRPHHSRDLMNTLLDRVRLQVLAQQATPAPRVAPKL